MAEKEIPEIEFQYERGDERMTEFGAVIPEGWYKGRFVNLEAKETKKEGAGEWYINLQCEVQEGPHKGTSMFEMLFLWATAEKTEQATRRRLNTILEAVDLPGMTKVNDLLDIDFMFKVKTQEAREIEDENTGEMKKFPARSQIVNYKSIKDYVPEEPKEEKAAPGKPGLPFGNKGKPSKTKEESSGDGDDNGVEQQEETKPVKETASSKPAGNKPPWVK